MTSCCPTVGVTSSCSAGTSTIGRSPSPRPGSASSIGERLKAVEPYLDNEEVFLANYSDGLTDLDLGKYVDTFLAQPDKVASFLAVQSTQSFHVADVADNGEVASIDPLSESDLWINGGFFVFRNEIFRHLHQGEDLVFEPFQRLIAERKLWAHRYRGFWTAMDTFKDRQALEERYEKGDAPWEVWKQPSGEGELDVEDWARRR